MSDHMTNWLGAYLDGELKGRKLHQVEMHLAECQLCQTELASLQGLSGLLHEIPAPGSISNERFVAQVNLRLPHRPVAATSRRLLEVGWWMAPVGLLMIWIFISTTIFISDMVSAANDIGLLNEATALLVSDSPIDAYWTSTLGQFGFLEGNSLQWAEMTESFTRKIMPQVVWQVSVALLYLTWISISWARQARRENGQFIEG